MDTSSSGTSGGGGGKREPGRAGFERAFRLPNTVHSEIVAALPLPTLPGTLDAFGLDDRDEPLAEPDCPDIIMQAATIADTDTNTSHLCFTEADHVEVDPSECSLLLREVLKHNPYAFKFKPRAPQPPPPLPPSQVPLSIYVLSLPLPYMPGGASLSTPFLVGAAVLVLGLVLYNLPQNSTDEVKTD